MDFLQLLNIIMIFVAAILIIIALFFSKETNRHVLTLLFLGFISGNLSSFLFGSNPPFYDFNMFIVPGLLFGIFIGGYFLQKIAWYRVILFILASVASYFIAANLVYLMSNLHGGFSYQLGGFPGSILLLIGFHFTISRLTRGQAITLTLLGGLLGYLIFIDIFISSNRSNFWTTLVLWQSFMAAGLGWTVFGKKEPKTSKRSAK